MIARYCKLALIFTILIGYPVQTHTSVLPELCRIASYASRRIKQPFVQLRSTIKHYAWNKNLNSQLAQECDKQYPSLSKIKALLKEGADVHYAYQGRQPLHRAAYNGQTAAAAVLIEHGADPNGCSYDRETPLLAATCRNHTATTKLLLQAGADPYQTPDSFKSPAENTLYYDHELSNISLFAEHGVSLSDPITTNMTQTIICAGSALAALPCAAIFHDPASLACTLGSSALYLATKQYGSNRNTLLHIAAQNGNIKAVQELLKHQADVHALDFWGQTPADVASSPDIKQLIKRHIEKQKNDPETLC